MKYRNLTPFPSIAFESLDPQGKSFRVAVLRMTLKPTSGGALMLADPQTPLVMTDRYYTDIHKSSVQYESDLAPYKPRCDVIVLGNAVAPGKQPTPRFEADIKIRKGSKLILEKRITVTGPREWRKRFLKGWTLTSPTPIVSLPLTYEYAYGGECRIESDDPASSRIKPKDLLSSQQKAQHPDGIEKAPAAHSCFEANTIGRGYSEPWYVRAKKLERLPAPQIESISDPVCVFGQKYAPQGFGAIGRSWHPRIKYSGTIDEAFIKNGRPLPTDFDFAYWNAAHPDLQLSELHGGETIELINIGAGVSRWTLPEASIHALLKSSDGQMFSYPFHIDTLIIEANENKIILVYRLKLPKESSDELLEVMLLNTEEKKVLDQHSQAITSFALQRDRLRQEAVHG